MSHKYKAGDLLQIKSVPDHFRHAFITKVDSRRYHLYFLTMPDKHYSYAISEIENDDVCFKISR